MLTQKLSILVNPPRGMKRSKGVTVNDSKCMCASDCVSSYPNEPLTVSKKTLFLELSGGIVTEEQR